RYDIANGHGHPTGSARGGVVFGRVDQPDIECPLEFLPDIVFGDEVTLLDLFDQDLTLLDCLCKVERGPLPLFPCRPDTVGVIVDEFSFHQVKDVSPPPPGGLLGGESRLLLRGAFSPRLLDFCTVFRTSHADAEFCTLDMDDFR